MLLSAVSVLVVAQSSSEVPEGLLNNPVYYGLVMHGNSNIKKKGLLNVRNVFNRHKSVQLKSLQKLQNLELATY